MDADRALEGRVIAVPEARQLDVLASLLEKRGAAVVRCPLIGIKDTPDQDAVLAWLKRFSDAPPDLMIFYTGEGLERLLEAARRAGIEAPFCEALAGVPKLTRGPKPKRALRRIELTPQFEASAPTTQGLIETLRTIELASKRVAMQLYNAEQPPELAAYLRERGARVDSVAPYVYASAAEDQQVVDLIERMRAGQIDAIAFTSKAQIQRMQRLARDRDLDEALKAGLAVTKVAAIGPVVATELTDAGIRVDCMPIDSYSMKPLVTALAALLTH